MARATLSVVLVLALGLVSLVGCATDPEPPAAGSPVPPQVVTDDCATWPESPADPVALELPGQPVAPVLRVGLTEAKDTDLLPLDRRPEAAGWYCYSPTPPAPTANGRSRSTVLVGHVDWNGGQPAVFARVHALRAGQLIGVRLRSGQRLSYQVTRVTRTPKTEFPFRAVYGSTPVPRLTLVTCGGSFDREAGSYRDSDIAQADYRPAG